MKPVIISGGPGAGKTTLINTLAARGYQIYAEGSRTLIEEQSQQEDGILPWNNLPAFAQLCFALMNTQKNAALESGGIAFMDRAIPDICAYLTMGKCEIEPELIIASEGYNQNVFICEPEKSIYVQDDVRPYPFEEALVLHQGIIDTYQEMGFTLISVPWGTIEARADFVESVI